MAGAVPFRIFYAMRSPAYSTMSNRGAGIKWEAGIAAAAKPSEVPDTCDPAKRLVSPAAAGERTWVTRREGKRSSAFTCQQGRPASFVVGCHLRWRVERWRFSVHRQIRHVPDAFTHLPLQMAQPRGCHNANARWAACKCRGRLAKRRVRTRRMPRYRRGSEA